MVMFSSSKIVPKSGIKHFVKLLLSIKKSSETCTKSHTVTTNT